MAEIKISIADGMNEVNKDSGRDFQPAFIIGINSDHELDKLIESAVHAPELKEERDVGFGYMNEPRLKYVVSLNGVLQTVSGHPNAVRCLRYGDPRRLLAYIIALLNERGLTHRISYIEDCCSGMNLCRIVVKTASLENRKVLLFNALYSAGGLPESPKEGMFYIDCEKDSYQKFPVTGTNGKIYDVTAGPLRFGNLCLNLLSGKGRNLELPDKIGLRRVLIRDGYSYNVVQKVQLFLGCDSGAKGLFMYRGDELIPVMVKYSEPRNGAYYEMTDIFTLGTKDERKIYFGENGGNLEVEFSDQGRTIRIPENSFELNPTNFSYNVNKFGWLREAFRLLISQYCALLRLDMLDSLTFAGRTPVDCIRDSRMGHYTWAFSDKNGVRTSLCFSLVSAPYDNERLNISGIVLGKNTIFPHDFGLEACTDDGMRVIVTLENDCTLKEISIFRGGKFYKLSSRNISENPEMTFCCPPFSSAYRLDISDADSLINAENYMSMLAAKLSAMNFDSEISEDSEMNEICRRLYPDGMVCDESIVREAEKLVKYVRMNEKVPCGMITGEPGTGKTTLARNLASCLPDPVNRVVVKSASDLIGQFVGQTQPRVFDALVEAYESNSILLIDEAYTLLDNVYGKEALAMILPIISGDRTVIEKMSEPGPNGSASKVTYEFTNGAPAIWLSGYSQELRSMVAGNPGLYRRMKFRISMQNPTTSRLYNTLLAMADSVPAKKLLATDIGCAQTLKDIISSNSDLVKSYFCFGSRNENIRFFANYAGAADLLESLLLVLDSKASAWENREAVAKVIEEKKQEINRQRKAVIASGKSLCDSSGIAVDVVSDIDLSLSDIIGSENVRSELSSVINAYIGKDSGQNFSINPQKGILFAGYPGTGKTFAARAMAGELQKRFEKSNMDKRTGFIPISATMLLMKPEMVKSLFATASEYDMCVIFIDEFDAIGKKRSDNPAYPVLMELMTEMDGFEQRGNIFLLAATNAPELLDFAVTRKGRFNKVINFELPELHERREMLARLLEKHSDIIKLPDEDVDRIAAKTTGYTISDLDSLVNESCRFYIECSAVPDCEAPAKLPHRFVRCGGKTESEKLEWYKTATPAQNFMADLGEVIERDILGAPDRAKKEDKFVVDRNSGCTATAIHEVGHALTAILCGKNVEKITVIPRGNCLGYVMHDSSEKLNCRSDFISRIRVALGGRVAEELFYGAEDVSVGAAKDLATATELARSMVCTFGMSDRFGAMRLTADSLRYLGGEHYTCSDDFRRMADEEICSLLNEQLEATRKMLSGNKDIIRQLAEFVFDRETVSGEELRAEYERLNSQLTAKTA